MPICDLCKKYFIDADELKIHNATNECIISLTNTRDALEKELNELISKQSIQMISNKDINPKKGYYIQLYLELKKMNSLKLLYLTEPDELDIDKHLELEDEKLYKEIAVLKKKKKELKAKAEELCMKKYCKF